MDIAKCRNLAWSSVIALALSGGAVDAADGEPGQWKFGAELYFWGASLGGTTTSGNDISLGIDQIVKNLNFGAMGTIAAQKGDLTLFSDLIYLDVGDKRDLSVSIGQVVVPITASIDLKGFITTTGAGYRVYEQSGTSLDVTGGLRFLLMDTELDISAGNLSDSFSRSLTNWDAVVGFRGKTDLSEKVYLTYYADIGAGESDLTWQALGALNYRLERVDLTLGYRYLNWDFNDFGPIDDLQLHGAFAGVKIPF